MWAILSTILGPVLSILDKIFGYVANVETTKITAEAQVETAAIQGTAAVEQKWWFVAAMIPLITIPYALYIWKAIAWDKLIAPMFNLHGAWATTDPITGTLGYVFTIVVTGLFLHSLVKF